MYFRERYLSAGSHLAALKFNPQKAGALFFSVTYFLMYSLHGFHA